MEVLHFDPNATGGKFKILNATNGGPLHKRHANDQYRDNFEEYRAARIPYSRNHDSNACTIYGGPYAHDITAIFPRFEADENDPASYDFACTDENILVTLEAGTETFFRLGQTIEHQIKKHGTLPPADFGKWARICEHIIRHYNEGWADGYRLNIQYWEIWNEPDLDADDCQNKRTWGGTRAEFFDLYEITAKHLKACFPHLKIGGPALAYNEEWAENFLSEMQRRGVELDFFSWHIYACNVTPLVEKSERIRRMLDKYGYEKTESILNEWNYIKGWEEDYIPSLLAICGMKGAAFTMACISAAQASSIDMLMYYDTRPGCFNGAFDIITWRPLKGYYPLCWYGEFYDMQAEIRCKDTLPDLYTLCGKDENGKLLCVLIYYSDDENAPEREVRLDFGRTARFAVTLLDEEHTATSAGETEAPTFTLHPNTCIKLREL